MSDLVIHTRGKINLTLDIINKRKDGYHNVSMVMQSIKLCDTLKIKLIDSDIKIICDNSNIPTGFENIIYKAAWELKTRYNVEFGVEIDLAKRIPFAAGLAGGSSNAAGTLIGLNELWNLDLRQEELLEIGSNIGADVPFCMLEGTALAEGIGNKLTKLKDMPLYYVVLIKPDLHIATPWAYSLINVEDISLHPDNKGMIKAIEAGDCKTIPEKLGNVFEGFIFKKYPQLTVIKEELKNLGAQGQLMSGSGPTVYGLFSNKLKALKATELLRERYNEVYLTETFN